MNKLRLFISVGVCSILFTGCGFFDSLFGLNDKQEGSKTKGRVFVCHPQDLKNRLDLYYFANKQYSKDEIAEFINSVKGFFKDSDDSSKCDNWIIERYKEISSKTIMPTSYPAEIQFTDKWNTCNAMPEWLNSKLNEYIEQSKSDDKAYIGASKFKEYWKKAFDSKLKYYDYWVIGSGYTFDYGTYKEKAKIYESSWKEPSLIERQLKCKAVQVATKAIENDLIDLDNGKKAKCADLSHKDAWRCQSLFDSVYKKAKADYELKQQRIEYEKKNRQ